VQRITEQHGGTLHLADAPKRNGKVQGASVRMDLPLGERDDAGVVDGGGTGARAEEAGAPAPAPEGKEPAKAAKEKEGVTHGV
jgi:hypothetical protein